MQEEEDLSPIHTEVGTEVQSKAPFRADMAAAGFRSTAQSFPQDDVFPAKTESNVLGDPGTAKSNTRGTGYTVSNIDLSVPQYQFAFISGRKGGKLSFVYPTSLLYVGRFPLCFYWNVGG